MDVLKSGFGWSDRQLEEQAQFNVQVHLCRSRNDFRQ
jgi:hypothetical protein